MEEYTSRVMEHFTNPRNVGQIKDASGRGKVGNPVCGDIMELFIKVDEAGVITDARFRTFGCGAAIASSSMLTELVKGKTVKEAENLTNKKVVDALGGLPEVKVHCSLLAEEARVVAYRAKRDRAETTAALDRLLAETTLRPPPPPTESGGPRGSGARPGPCGSG